MSKKRGQEWKVGLFMVMATALLMAALFWLGASRLNSDVVERVTYFDESVQGLEAGAPVKFRGVTIGKVTQILVAPDRRLVEVHAEIATEAMERITLTGEHLASIPEGQVAPPELRMVIAAQGITGIKFLEADYFPPETPQVKLSFEPPPSYVPSAPSTLKGLEDAVRAIGEELPQAIHSARALANTLEKKMVDLDLAGMTDSVKALSDDLRTVLKVGDPNGLAGEALLLMAEARVAVEAVDGLMLEAAGENGSMARITASVENLQKDVGDALQRVEGLLEDSDLPGTTASVRGAANSATHLAADLRPTANAMPEVLRDLRAALRSVDELASLIDRDPGVFLRGRSPSPPPR